MYHIQGQHATYYNTDVNWSQVYILSVCCNDHMYIVMKIKKIYSTSEQFQSYRSDNWYS
jgi:hypothetical protein